MRALPPELAPKPPEAAFQITLADLEGLAEALQRFEAFCSKWGVPDNVKFGFELALDELVSNSIRHGFKGAWGEPEVSLSVAREDGFLVACIVDGGIAFDPFEEAPKPDIALDPVRRPIGGLGVHLVRSMIEETGYERRGGRNRLLIRQPLSADSPGG